METSSNTIDKKQFSLQDFCIYDAKLYGDEFVGIKYENNKLSIQFPAGYKKADNDIQCRKDILNLFTVLSSFSDKKESSFENNDFIQKEHTDFPMHAYLYIISDFLTKGYYSETESIYKRAKSGKINWNRTIKQIKPQFINEDVIYLDFITKHTNYNENELISQIHKYCVYESFSKIGFIFSSFKPQKPQLLFNYNLFKSVIQTKIGQTFNVNQQLLFRNMIDIIDYLDSSKDSKSFYYGTNNFEYIWENLVNTVYGINNKEDYFPHCYWKLNSGKTVDFSDDKFKNYSLRPDTIMITKTDNKEKIFILDSKYYKFGITDCSTHLPSSSSILKQITYGEYIDETLNKDGNNIYNAFIMPYSSENNDILKYVGYCSGEHKLLKYDFNSAKPYYKIQGILLDVKTLMYNHKEKDNDAIKILADFIETHSK